MGESILFLLDFQVDRRAFRTVSAYAIFLPIIHTGIIFAEATIQVVIKINAANLIAVSFLVDIRLHNRPQTMRKECQIMIGDQILIFNAILYDTHLTKLKPNISVMCH